MGVRPISQPEDPWRSHLLVASLFFVLGTDLFMISPLIPEISASTGVSVQQASLVTSVFAATYMVCGPPAALLSDRFTRRIAISAGGVLFGIGALIAAGTGAFGIVLAGRVVCAIGAAFMSAPVWAYVTETAAPARTGRAVALVSGTFAAGQIVGVPLSAFLAGWGSWQLAFLLTGSGAILAAIFVFVRLRSEPRHSSAGTLRSGIVRSLRVWRQPRLVLLMATNVFGQGARQAPYTFAGAIMVSRFGVGVDVLGWIGAIVGAGSLLGATMGGRVIDWVRRRGIPQPLVSLVAALVVSATLPVAILADAIAVVAVGWVCVFGFGAVLVSNVQEQLTRTAGEDRVYALSWNNSGLYAGVATGTILLSLFPLASAGFVWVAVGVALSSAVCSALLVAIRRQRGC
ncbi:MAG: hypothetical protein DSY74_02425 [Actinobacteria bacterium]|nr:MAG: hypothetical protein DSY74_02425 [Actinomycetota bacterium]